MSPTPQFVVRFTGKISWDGRANGLPEEIYGFLIFDGYNREIFSKAIDDQTTAFIRGGGMAVQKEQGKVIDMRQVPADRIFIPMRWIVSISVDAYQLASELSLPDETGTERLKDGSEPVKN